MISNKALFDAMRDAATEIYRGHFGLGYHNWDHITHAVTTHDRLFGAGGDLSAALMAQKLAIYFHDAVYIPACGKNEEMSAKLFSWHLARVVGYSEYQKIHDSWLDTPERGLEPTNDMSLLQACMFVPSWIQSTMVTHHLSGHELPPSIEIILDCDLASFAKPWAGFVASQVAIMEEQMPGACNGEDLNLPVLAKQATFLKALLKKARIYRTQAAFNEFEETARENIQTLLDYVAIQIHCLSTLQGQRYRRREWLR